MARPVGTICFHLTNEESLVHSGLLAETENVLRRRLGFIVRLLSFHDCELITASRRQLLCHRILCPSPNAPQASRYRDQQHRQVRSPQNSCDSKRSRASTKFKRQSQHQRYGKHHRLVADEQQPIHQVMRHPETAPARQSTRQRPTATPSRFPDPHAATASAESRPTPAESPIPLQ